MKKFFTALNFVLLSSIAYASGPLDGIYSCGVKLLGSTYSSYITINGHSDGGSIFVVAAVGPSQTFYGFGIGGVTANNFTGSTMFGAPFSLTYNSSNGSLVGNIGILWGSTIVNANSSCTKIW